MVTVFTHPTLGKLSSMLDVPSYIHICASLVVALHFADFDTGNNMRMRFACTFYY